MAREVNIMTPEQVEVSFELAGIGSRCIAMIIDILWQALGILVLFLLFLASGGSSPDLFATSTWLIVFYVVILFFTMGGYFLYFESSKNGQTPGKKAVGIRVVRDTGHPIDFRSALLRNLMRLVDFLPFNYGVAIISVFFSPEYRRLGDYVGGTLVVKVGKKAEDLAPRAPVMNAPMQVDPVGMPTTAAPVSALPEEAMPFITTIQKDEYRAIRHFLDRRIELTALVAQNLSKQLAEPVAAKLYIDIAQIYDHTAFLTAVAAEWERRAIH